MSALYPDAVGTVEPAYEAAMFREIQTILNAVPLDQLAFQWDVCLEMLLFDGRVFPVEWDDDAYRARFSRLTNAIPSDVHLGCHLCYGDYDGKHTVEPIDAANLTELANLIAVEAQRPLQFLHMPVPIERDDESYFAPLESLDLHDETELFLGVIHHADGVEGAQRRMAAAESFVSGFGVATECGIGRIHSTPEVEQIFDIHAELTDQ